MQSVRGTDYADAPCKHESNSGNTANTVGTTAYIFLKKTHSMF